MPIRDDFLGARVEESFFVTRFLRSNITMLVLIISSRWNLRSYKIFYTSTTQTLYLEIDETSIGDIVPFPCLFFERYLLHFLFSTDSYQP